MQIKSNSLNLYSATSWVKSIAKISKASCFVLVVLIFFVFNSYGVEQKTTITNDNPKQIIQPQDYLKIGQLEGIVNQLKERLEKSEEDQSEATKKLSEIEKYFWILITLYLAFFLVIVTYVKTVIKRHVSNVIDKHNRSFDEQRDNQIKILEEELKKQSNATLKKLRNSYLILYKLPPYVMLGSMMRLYLKQIGKET